jgi:hypothetical protein
MEDVEADAGRDAAMAAVVRVPDVASRVTTAARVKAIGGAGVVLRNGMSPIAATTGTTTAATRAKDVRALSLTSIPVRAWRSRDPGQELGHPERFGHVVVGAGIEGRHLDGFGAPGRQHDDGHRGPRPQPLGHLDATDTRQAEVEDHDIGALAAGQCRSPAASERRKRKSRGGVVVR